VIIAHPTARDRPLDILITDFLADLAHSNRSPHTRQAYAADLSRFSSFYTGPAGGITADVLRAFFATRTHLSPATRANAGGAGQFPGLGLSPRPDREPAHGTRGTCTLRSATATRPQA